MLYSNFNTFHSKKMAAQTTSHYELYDEEKDIMIYGMRIEEIFSEGIEINTETINTIHQTIPDVMAKCLNSAYSKKAIVFYHQGVMEILQMRYYFYLFKMRNYIFLMNYSLYSVKFHS